MTIVVNKNKDPYDIYCGRGSLFGNPFIIGRDGTRAQVIEKFEEWFEFLIKDNIFRKEVFKLKDKTLGCFCKPLDCHCDVIADYLNKI